MGKGTVKVQALDKESLPVAMGKLKSPVDRLASEKISMPRKGIGFLLETFCHPLHYNPSKRRKGDKMEEELMSKVFTIKDTEPFQVLPSGHTAWLLASVGNLSVQIIESKTAGQPVEFPAPSGEEEFIYVLRGHVQYDDGRTARMGEAVYNPPDLSSPSKYSGQLLRIAVFTESRGTQPRKDLLGMVFNVDNVKSFYDDKAMTTRRLWVVTQNMSIVMNESQPGTRFVDTGHPEKEIIYVIRGCLEYDNGRTVTDGEAVVNLPDKLHPGRRCGTAPTRSFEAKTPAPERLLEMFEA